MARISSYPLFIIKDLECISSLIKQDTHHAGIRVHTTETNIWIPFVVSFKISPFEFFR